jgi:hypothetical protein
MYACQKFLEASMSKMAEKFSFFASFLLLPLLLRNKDERGGGILKGDEKEKLLDEVHTEREIFIFRLSECLRLSFADL